MCQDQRYFACSEYFNKKVTTLIGSRESAFNFNQLPKVIAPSKNAFQKYSLKNTFFKIASSKTEFQNYRYKDIFY